MFLEPIQACFDALEWRVLAEVLFNDKPLYTCTARFFQYCWKINFALAELQRDHAVVFAAFEVFRMQQRKPASILANNSERIFLCKLNPAYVKLRFHKLPINRGEKLVIHAYTVELRLEFEFMVMIAELKTLLAYFFRHRMQEIDNTAPIF
ncbi:hypothetical protein D3C84_953730 [compost metagenome]